MKIRNKLLMNLHVYRCCTSLCVFCPFFFFVGEIDTQIAGGVLVQSYLDGRLCLLVLSYCFILEELKWDLSSLLFVAMICFVCFIPH